MFGRLCRVGQMNNKRGYLGGSQGGGTERESRKEKLVLRQPNARCDSGNF